MKALLLTSISLFAIAACTQQMPPPSSQDAVANPTSVGGSASNTTSTSDGTYQGSSIRGDSGVGPGLRLVDKYSGCQPFAVPPTMTITDGLAQFQAAGSMFAGYVIPQGNLTMD